MAEDGTQEQRKAKDTTDTPPSWLAQVTCQVMGTDGAGQGLTALSFALAWPCPAVGPLGRNGSPLGPSGQEWEPGFKANALSPREATGPSKPGWAPALLPCSQRRPVFLPPSSSVLSPFPLKPTAQEREGALQGRPSPTRRSYGA